MKWRAERKMNLDGEMEKVKRQMVKRRERRWKVILLNAQMFLHPHTLRGMSTGPWVILSTLLLSPTLTKHTKQNFPTETFHPQKQRTSHIADSSHQALGVVGEQCGSLQQGWCTVSFRRSLAFCIHVTVTGQRMPFPWKNFGMNMIYFYSKVHCKRNVAFHELISIE